MKAYRVWEANRKIFLYPENWLAPEWPAPGRVRALVTTRAGGVSSGPYESLNLGSRVGSGSFG